MRSKLTIFTILWIGVFFVASCVFGEAPKGTTYSRPNLSGGYDFYDSSGEKTGYSTKRRDGGYNYYNQYGNKTGYLTPTKKSGVYQYYDADNVHRGRLSSHPYGGYRYYEKKEGLETPAQKQIRRDHDYQNPYGSGVETFSPEVIKGKE